MILKCFWNFSTRKIAKKSYQTLIGYLIRRTVIDGEKNIVGAVNIRHRLNQKLINSGGHIGYGICPGQRRKGYATALLSFALEKTKELGLDRVLVVCDKDNIGSERTILKNGGVFESEYIEDNNGNVVRRFWINLSKY